MRWPLEKQLFLRSYPRFARLAVVMFFMSLAFSFFATVWSVYIKDFVGKEYLVGLIITLLSVFSVLSSIFGVFIIQKYNKSRIFKTGLIILAISYAILAINTSFYLFILLAITLTFLRDLSRNSFGIIVRGISTDKKISRNQGFIYTFLNASWLLGPLIAGLIAVNHGKGPVFLMSGFFILLTFIVFQNAKINISKKSKKIEKSQFKNALSFFNSKDRKLAYLFRSGVIFWCILLFTFMPLYIVKKGLTEAHIGYFMFAVAVPLIFLEYPFSKMVGKYKYKSFFKTGYLILGALSLTAFLFSNIYIVMTLLVIASIGLAMLEPTTEAYFFRLMNKEQELKYYSIFNTTIGVSFFTASLISSIILFFLPFEYLFIFFGITMLGLFFLSSKARNVM